MVDLGPGPARRAAASSTTARSPASRQAEGSATGDYLSGRKRSAGPAIPTPGDQAGRPADRRPRQQPQVDRRAFPLGVLCVVTGVSGAGKSTLVEETLYPALRQSDRGRAGDSAARTPSSTSGADVAGGRLPGPVAAGRSARSNPVTYLKAFDEIRKTFAATHEAKLRNYDAGKFSFNVEGGRCNACQGDGFLTIDMQFLPDVMVRCPECRGTRYRPEILEITYRGRNIAEVLDLTAREAFGFFRHRPKVQARLRPLLDIGLDYLTARPAGLDALRRRGAAAQAGGLPRPVAGRAPPRRPAPHTLFLLDEPTAGLHPVDILKLLEALDALVDRGHSLIVDRAQPRGDALPPTGSSTSARAPATKAAGSWRRERPKRSRRPRRRPARSWRRRCVNPRPVDVVDQSSAVGDLSIARSSMST